MNYLWCKRCEHAYLNSQWTHDGLFVPGVCPNLSCAAPAYNSALEWSHVALANDYPLCPDPYTCYPLEISLF
jgi:hypothetical protein